MIWKRSGSKRIIRQQTLQLVSALNRWCQVREDLLYAFQKSLDHGLSAPMRPVVTHFVTRVNSGMSVEQALSLMENSLDQEHFRDLMSAIRFNFRFRGDLPKLLSHLEWQMNRIEEEYTRRKLSQARDRRWTIGVLAAVPASCLIRFVLQPSVRQALIGNTIGHVCLLAGASLYMISLTAFFVIERKLNE